MQKRSRHMFFIGHPTSSFVGRVDTVFPVVILIVAFRGRCFHHHCVAAAFRGRCLPATLQAESSACGLLGVLRIPDPLISVIFGLFGNSEIRESRRSRVLAQGFTGGRVWIRMGPKRSYWVYTVYFWTKLVLKRRRAYVGFSPEMEDRKKDHHKGRGALERGRTDTNKRGT